MEGILLGYIRVLCHDILNHLQVVSGLAQLQKAERIGRYVAEVGNQIKEIGRVARLENRHLATALFGCLQWFSRYGVPYRLTVAAEAVATPAGGIPPGSLVDGLALLGREMASRLEGLDRPLLVAVEVEGSGPRVRITLPGDREDAADVARACAAAVEAGLAEGGGQVQVLHGDGPPALLLTFPALPDAGERRVEE
ncbi:MAG: Spo0B domain-containing protein [Bacillota bacterium]